MRRTEHGLLALGTMLVGLGVACGGDDQGPATAPAGHREAGGQERRPARPGRSARALGNPVRILITRDGEPVEGVNVTWAAGQRGSLSDQTESDELGIATAVWTLGPETGTQAATATVDGADGSPLTFTATATDGTGPPPGPTIQVLGPDGGQSVRARHPDASRSDRP